MAHSPEYLARRRRARIKRRRVIAATTLVILLAAVGIGAYVLGRPHRVVVVHVAAQVHDTPAKVAVPGEYPAAPGAPSLKSVEAELARSDAERHAGAGSSPGPATGAGGSVLDSRAAASFQQFASSLPGRVELAVTPLGGGSSEVLGNDEAAHGWSTTKVPVLISLMRARGSEGLTSQELTWAHAAITESDNQSVLGLFGDLERLKGGLGGASEYMDSVLRAGGDSETTVATAPPPAGAVTTFGQTQWSPSEAVKFFRALDLGCLLPAGQTSYVLGLMQSVEPSESWGLGSAGFGSVAFKGGWGPEGDGYLVRQSGIVEPRSSSGAAVAIVAFAPSFGSGTEMLTRTASWLNHHLALRPRASAGCSGE
jgi:hypothetical protein